MIVGCRHLNSGLAEARSPVEVKGNAPLERATRFDMTVIALNATSHPPEPCVGVSQFRPSNRRIGHAADATTVNLLVD